MRILWIQHPGHDRGAMLLYKGLVEILGSHMIDVWPYYPPYEGATLTVKGIPHDPPAEDPTVSEWIKSDLVDCVCFGGVSSPPTDGPNVPQNRLTETDVISRVQSGYYNTLVMGDPRRFTAWFVEKLKRVISRDAFPLFVLNDHEDYQDIRVDLIHSLLPDIYFKNTLIPGFHQNHGPVYPSPYYTHLRPLPMSSPVSPEKSEELLSIQKVTDVHIRIGSTHPLRIRTLGELACLKYRFIGGCVSVQGGHSYFEVPGHLKWPEYLKEVASCKAGISMRGWPGTGRNPFRHWEVPMCNSALVCDPPAIEIPDNLTDRENCVHFDPERPDTLKDSLGWLFSEPGRLEEITRRGREHTTKYHTYRARAQYWLDIVGSASAHQGLSTGAWPYPVWADWYNKRAAAQA